ncbi:branched-chain amino acid ABC transporter permease [Massilia psychrophila]|uniref:Branched-chain amino acid ABC transporter permease n=1 Tax=Massilia psychrophila TaxID=1603353 RepID=A0A2G8T334_9BURK|nr:branched-chain amino acid ABC transporter permease [Massilia psychrophila]PIL40441.1 branched-chain amino acid ABC transporter permease [Massilia psychrophila]GGE77283.1 branched-chain amino acid ABC transporter permease [Massilia psychrophila]
MSGAINAGIKINKTLVALIVAGYAVVPFALGANNYIMSMIVAALVIGGVALSWALLGNLGGMVSFGHSAFFGVGAYVSALVTVKLGVPVLLALPLGGVGAVLASIVMMPVLRLRGPYFALAILAYAHIFRILATEWSSVTGGSGGVSGIPGFPTVFGFDFGTKMGAYLIALTLVLVFAFAYARIRASYYGIALRAMHDSEDATRVVGVNSTVLKAAMLMVSAFMAGVFGALNAHYINFLEPDYAFNALWVTLPVVAAIFGGYRTISGPVIGALVVYMADQLVFKALMPTGHQLVLGVLLVMMIVFSPSGLMPLLKKWTARHA